MERFSNRNKNRDSFISSCSSSGFSLGHLTLIPGTFWYVWHLHNTRRILAKPLLYLKKMKAMAAYEINIFQTHIFILNCKIQTVPLIYQDLFTIKPRNKFN